MKTDLMTPRYLVAMDYPNSLHQAGVILHQSPIGYCFNPEEITTPHNIVWKEIITKYPHIFKPLKWYERRAIEEMPEYVKCKGKFLTPKGIYKVDKWYNNNLIGAMVIIPPDSGAFIGINQLTPATEQEYISFTSKK